MTVKRKEYHVVVINCDLGHYLDLLRMVSSFLWKTWI